MNQYSEIPVISISEVENIIASGDLSGLRICCLSLSLHSNDKMFAEQVCKNLSTHLDEQVRGNAILGLGHLARRFRSLTSECKKIVELGLKDKSEYVNGQAWAAADDIQHFLSWKIEGFNS